MLYTSKSLYLKQITSFEIDCFLNDKFIDIFVHSNYIASDFVYLFYQVESWNFQIS